MAEKTAQQGLECVFAHGRDADESGWVKPDWLVEGLAKWKAMAAFVRRCNAWFQPCDYPSLYRSSFLNPMNLVGLKFMFNRFGIRSTPLP